MLNRLSLDGLSLSLCKKKKKKSFMWGLKQPIFRQFKKNLGRKKLSFFQHLIDPFFGSLSVYIKNFIWRKPECQ